MRFAYQHSIKDHLQRYAAETEFRCNTCSSNGEEVKRVVIVIRSAIDDRLAYPPPDTEMSAAL
jgi:hypothetical protein